MRAVVREYPLTAAYLACVVAAATAALTGAAAFAVVAAAGAVAVVVYGLAREQRSVHSAVNNQRAELHDRLAVLQRLIDAKPPKPPSDYRRHYERWVATGDPEAYARMLNAVRLDG